MQKIGSILTRAFRNPTLQRAYFEQQAGAALETLLETNDLHSWRDELTSLVRRKDRDVTVYLSSSNALLLTHLRLQTTRLETEYLDLLRTQGVSVEQVTFKLRTK